MSDEQTRLPQEILGAVREQTAFTKQYRDEAMAVQHAVLKRQKLAVRVVLVFMSAAIAFMAYALSRG